MSCFLYLFFIGVILCSATGSNGEVEIGKIYTLQNAYDEGFLTAISNSPHVVTDKWRDIATQKWRSTSPNHGWSLWSDENAMNLRPLAQEDSSLQTSSKGDVFVDTASLFSFGSYNQWKFIPSEQNLVFVVSVKTGECLESKGFKQNVGTSRCRDSIAQKWAMFDR